MTLCHLLMVQGAHAQAQPVSPLTQQHELLKKDVGTWNTSIKVWTSPNKAPIASQGVETSELLSGGLWLVTRFEGSMNGAPCVGMGTWGYDPVERQYVGTWVDSMTPHVTLIRGDYDPASKTMSHISEGRDPASGESYARKSTLRYLDDGTRVVEAYATGPDGQSWKSLEVMYQRRME
jgi:hypothetical protein